MSRIREFRPEDYVAIAEVYNAAFPADAYRTHPEDLEHDDRAASPKYKSRRFVLCEDSRVVGVVQSQIPMDFYHPRKFYMWMGVHPDHQRRGLGGGLYTHLLASLQPEGQVSLRTHCREDMASGLRFLATRGFREEHRSWESVLDLKTVDPSWFAGIEKRVESQGIRIQTLAELSGTPDWDRKLYEVFCHVERDMPATMEYVKPPFEDFAKRVFESPRLVPEALQIAMDGDRVVGISHTEPETGAEKTFITQTTGVLRDYRRRGIATAMKLRGIVHAKAAGAWRLRTYNDATNRAMLSINERLGFVKSPAWIGFVREFRGKRRWDCP